jgi:NAD(P)-dependent dehydrogenase (short-subunit alcohol dehydrogenase family)
VVALVAKKVAEASKRANLQGVVVAISGASRGLGLALAREFGARGAAIAICARDRDVLERAAGDLAARGVETLALQCDIRDRAAVERFVEAVVDRYGRLDVLVNNAGTIAVGPFGAMDDEDYRDGMQTHFWAPHYMVSAALPHLRASRGRVVNIASIGGLVSVPHLLPYSASKFALVGYSLGLRQELAESGVCVTTICPGLMRTGSPRNATFKGRHRSEYAWFDAMASSPLTSISAESAARQIVDAAVARKNLVILSPQAQLLALTARLAPDLVTAINTVVSRALPHPNGDSKAARGSESESAFTQSPITALGRKAERDLNQLPAR